MDKACTPDKYRCKNCRQQPEMFMLLDHIWKEVTDNGRDHLCLKCCESKLRRSLTIDDFNPDIPCNRVIFFAYMLGRGQ